MTVTSPVVLFSVTVARPDPVLFVAGTISMPDSETS